MSLCYFCDAPGFERIPITKHNGEWVKTSGVDGSAVHACLDCAEEKLDYM